MPSSGSNVDPRTGAITRILDKANGRQALRPGGRANVLWVEEDIRADRAGPDGFTRGERQEVVRVLSLSASVSARAASITILRQWGASTIRQDLVLGRTAPFLDVHTEVVWKEDDRRLSVEFEPVIAPNSATWEIPYGTMSRASAPETESARSNAVFPGQRWADVSAGGYGFSVLTAAGREWEVRGGTIAAASVAGVDADARGPPAQPAHVSVRDLPARRRLDRGRHAPTRGGVRSPARRRDRAFTPGTPR